MPPKIFDFCAGFAFVGFVTIKSELPSTLMLIKVDERELASSEL